MGQGQGYKAMPTTSPSWQESLKSTPGIAKQDFKHFAVPAGGSYSKAERFIGLRVDIVLVIIFGGYGRYYLGFKATPCSLIIFCSMYLLIFLEILNPK